MSWVCLADRSLAVAGAAWAVTAAAGGLRGRDRTAAAAVDVALVLLVASLVTLAVVTDDLLGDVPAEALARGVAVLGLAGVRAVLAAAETPQQRRLAARIAPAGVVVSLVLTGLGVWRWLGWPAVCDDPGPWWAGAVAAAVAGGGVARWRAGRLAAADAALDAEVRDAITRRGEP